MTSFTDRQTPSVVVVGYTAGDLVDTEVTKGPLQSTANPEGAELIYAPNNSASLAVDYTIPLNEGWSLVPHADDAILSGRSLQPIFHWFPSRQVRLEVGYRLQLTHRCGRGSPGTPMRTDPTDQPRRHRRRGLPHRQWR